MGTRRDLSALAEGQKESPLGKVAQRARGGWSRWCQPTRSLLVPRLDRRHQFLPAARRRGRPDRGGGEGRELPGLRGPTGPGELPAKAAWRRDRGRWRDLRPPAKLLLLPGGLPSPADAGVAGLPGAPRLPGGHRGDARVASGGDGRSPAARVTAAPDAPAVAGVVRVRAYPLHERRPSEAPRGAAGWRRWQMQQCGGSESRRGERAG